MSDIDLEEWLNEGELKALDDARERYPQSGLTEGLVGLWTRIARLRKRVEELEEENERLREAIKRSWVPDKEFAQLSPEVKKTIEEVRDD